tara:strand:- start:545 stop:949 length:405 start_codon:yes stop_codon:yes gene_type:complete
MKYLLLLITVLLFSCSPIKRHARLVKKFPYVHTVDSVRLIDTVQLFTTAVHTDTVVEYTALLDGVTINKDNLTVEVLRIRDSIYINGSCDTVFIDSIVERMIPVKYYESVNTNKIPYYLYFVIVLLIFLLARKK